MVNTNFLAQNTILTVST